MLIIGRFGFGIFLSKEDLEGMNKRTAIGFRIFWKPRSWHDVYFYPNPCIQSTKW